ncbi:hypothetical protein [Methanosphaera cuniculi]|uniref:Uncharacterized protein n=1 Tax=Methanosphaera cuniculi TaxID=1077256 RepID=A0A2A2HDU1_9EURY|nr:hypothetical protein [Methanosphaera cuniculi]PAV07545.1 hypothetical protein ASJ82_07665 [Methanosphaera cuniculi]PWL08138.1 hypothetical protein MSCUN_10690 [Methanosphaera cuniculi]
MSITYKTTSTGTNIIYRHQIYPTQNIYKDKIYKGYETYIPRSLIEYMNTNTIHIYIQDEEYRISPVTPTTLEKYHTIKIKQNNMINIPISIIPDNADHIIYTLNMNKVDINTGRLGEITLKIIGDDNTI